MLQAAAKRGLLTRRESRIQKTWQRGEHGVNRLNPNEVAEPVDNVSINADPVNDIYLHSKTPEQQEKIRRLHVRAASRGAKPRVNYDQWTGGADVQGEIRQEFRKELVRRESRRSDYLQSAH